jgi:hypothetical protein
MIRYALTAISLLICCCCTVAATRSDEPHVSYIFPAGGQRGTMVHFHVGGHNLHDACPLEMLGPGIQAPAQLVRGRNNLWFEGPVIPLPDSQRGEDYPWPQEGSLTIDAQTPLGVRRWRVSTSQGVTASMRFVVGDFPEIVEQEIDGRPLPTPVDIPVTINGRIFPREDVDVWTFEARAGQSYVCEVMAARLGSPLDARLAVLDPMGEKVAENADTVNGDPRLIFTAAHDGVYQLHLHDMDYGGLQHYVYRLTISAEPYVSSIYPLGGRRGTALPVQIQGMNIGSSAELRLPDQGHQARHTLEYDASHSNEFVTELSDLPEFVEQTQLGESLQFSVPGVLNGRIIQPGEHDVWSFQAQTGEQFDFEVHAARLGSRLDSTIAVIGADGKELGVNDDAENGQPDSRLAFTAPSDGNYQLLVRDTFAHRGGPDFAYRIHATRPAEAAPDFQLILPADALTLTRGAEARLKIACRRPPHFKAPIELHVDGLPQHVSVSGTTIGENATETQLTFKATAEAAIQVCRLRIRGTANVQETALERAATLPPAFPLDMEVDHLMLAVAIPTPFKIVGDFETRYAARGATYLRHYRIDRGGYEGPLMIRLAERQVRHLQGVQGPVLTIPAGQNEFDYPVHLAPWMEVGRTSRTCLMGIGEVHEPDGSRHTVSYTSHAQNDQIIVLVDPGQMAVRLDRDSLRAEPGSRTTLPVRVERGPALTGHVRVELIVPAHMQGVSASAIELARDQSSGSLAITFADAPLGPLNMPVTVRATTLVEGHSYTAETPLSLVP